MEAPKELEFKGVGEYWQSVTPRRRPRTYEEDRSSNQLSDIQFHEQSEGTSSISPESDSATQDPRKMGPISRECVLQNPLEYANYLSASKRKADEGPGTPSRSKRIKTDTSEEPEENIPKAGNPIPFPEKPAVIEERNGEIEFRVVNNDNERESLIILTGLKCIFQKQLPKMPKDYIARLVYDGYRQEAS
jgi:hypothetical protein